MSSMQWFWKLSELCRKGVEKMDSRFTSDRMHVM